MSPRRTNPSDATPDRWRADPVVVAGTIQAADETEGLEVSLHIDSSRISMKTGANDLGSWPSGAVTITRIDETRFTFVAEGDRLIFIPADAETFASHPGIGDDTRTKRRRRTRSAQSPGSEASSGAAPTVQPPTKSKRRIARRKRQPKRQPQPATELEGQPTSASDAPVRRPPNRGVWIRMIDLARPYSIFSLDRVPVDPRLRGKEHQHTWDHSAARSSGPSHHLCTICGKVRWR